MQRVGLAKDGHNFTGKGLGIVRDSARKMWPLRGSFAWWQR